MINLDHCFKYTKFDEDCAQDNPAFWLLKSVWNNLAYGGYIVQSNNLEPYPPNVPKLVPLKLVIRTRNCGHLCHKPRPLWYHAPIDTHSCL